jgi:outer membrane protein assembly factor BamB
MHSLIPISILLIFFLLTAGCSTINSSSRSVAIELQGESLYSDGNVIEAVEYFKSSYLSDQKNYSAISKLVRLLVEQGRFREADKFLQKIPDNKRKSLNIESISEKPGTHSNVSFHWIWKNLADPEKDLPVGLASNDSVVIAAYQTGVVVCVRLIDGHFLWEKDLNTNISISPEFSDNLVLLTDVSGKIYALDDFSGEIRWQIHKNNILPTGILVEENLVYISSYSGMVSAHLIDNGNLLWQRSVSSAPVHKPIVEDGVLYIGSEKGQVFALNALTGENFWDQPAIISGGIEAQPVLVENKLLAATIDSRLYALATNGTDYYWRYSMPDSIFARPLVFEDNVYIFSIGESAAALNLEDGTPIWQVELPTPVRSSPVLRNSKLYLAGTNQPYLYVMDGANGDFVDTIHTGDWIEYGPIQFGETLLLAGKDGSIIAYRFLND